MSKVSIFSGGIPTEPEVKKLIEGIGPLAIGQIIAYEQIDAILGYHRNGPQKNRWRAVVGAYLTKQGREGNLVFKAIPNQGYKILNSRERIGWSAGKMGEGLKKIIRGGLVAQTTDRQGLSQEEMKKLDHLTNLAGTISLAHVTAKKQLKYPNLDKQPK